MPPALRLLAPLALLAFLALPALAQSPQAKAQRDAQDLTPFTPPEAFLTGAFLADEMQPAYLFASVREFAQSLKCPTAWLIEKSEKERIARPAAPEAPAEYSLWLEADCPDGVAYFVFTDQSAMTPAQWIAWRKRFHGSKAEGSYGQTKGQLEKAQADGMRVGGELRFIVKGGELLVGKTPEAVLVGELAVKPGYDLQKGQKAAP
ncbi:hypothetical protein NNJEOMEG_02217 [Fundidesulfovibrio magnetotacticus]|uniref:Uncharacterized protein n=1 Tax=Fundidesulfovibrio magnetotacticus TaxID=2730080 RepID=A0A6V8LP88_9BACT|nr:hypothetical protein [Fundidesulfovibrio magnetotacticus]GFK94373.1 hypothetical protein NNJEOMEG_02217 [Fundidesulfovibrio magnetotacticus]